MSTTIDERVVKMEFDNSNFDRRIEQSQRSLNHFNDYLEETSSESNTHFRNIMDSANNVNFDQMSNAVLSIADKFTVLGTMAKRAIEDITDSVYKFTTKTIKSLSGMEAMNAGWSKYEQKTSGVQTIMAATGKSIDEVSRSLEKLNWFTDETSYNYSDMINNIGKFTSAGVDLDDAVSAMEGIGTWASVSGANMTQASRAMYNLSQAMGSGSLKLIDWKSLENANMTTMEFKQTVIDTALALGNIKEISKGVYTAIDKSGSAIGKEFNINSMRDELNTGWITSTVITETLKKYSAYADALYEVSDAYDTCSQAMKFVSDEGMELGGKAFRAAQEAKTFAEAIEATKDAVSTGWMNTFELLFGNYKEATKLWTRLANDLWDTFASGGEYRNNMISSYVVPAWKNIEEAVVDSGIAVEDFEDSLKHVVNMKLGDDWIERYKKVTGTITDPENNGFESIRQQMTDLGYGWDRYLEKYENIQEAIIDGAITIDQVKEAFNWRKILTENAAYSENVEERFKDYIELVKKGRKEGKNYAEMVSKIKETTKGYGYNAEVVTQILNGQINSVEDLTDSQRRQILYQDHQISKYDEFTKTIKKLRKESKDYADFSKKMSEAGYKSTAYMGLASKILNGTISDFSMLNEEEQKLIYWTDETSVALNELGDSSTEAGKQFSDWLDELYLPDARTSVLNGLFNILENINQVLGIIRDAWHEVFTGLSSKEVKELALSFAEFTEKLKLNDDQAEKFSITVKGLFSVINIVKEALVSLLIPIQRILSHFTGTNTGILDLTASLGEFLINLNKTIEDTDFFATKMEKVADVIDKIIGFFAKMIDTFKSGFNAVDKDSGLISKISGGLTALIETLTAKAEDANSSPLVSFITTLMYSIAESLKYFVEIAEEALPYVKDAIVGILTFIKTAFEDFNWNALARMLGLIPKTIFEFIATMTGLNGKDWKKEYPGLYNIVLMIKDFGELAFDKMQKAFEKVKEILGDFVSWLGDKFSNMTPENFALIAFSFALIYMFINIGRLASAAVGAVKGLSTLGSTIKSGLDSISSAISGATGPGDFSQKFLRFTIGVAVVAASLMALSQMNAKSVWVAVGQIASVIGAFLVIDTLYKLLMKVSILQTASNPKMILTSLGGLVIIIVALGVSLAIMAAALKNIAKIKPNITDKVLSIIAIIIGALAILSLLAILINKAASSGTSSIGSALIMTAMAFAVGKFAEALAILQRFKMEGIYDAMTSMVSIMISFGILITLTKGLKVGSALALLIIVAIIDTLAEGINKLNSNLNSIPFDMLTEHMLGLISAIMIFSIIMSLISGLTGGTKGGSMSSIGTGLLLAMSSILVLALAIQKMNEVLSGMNGTQFNRLTFLLFGIGTFIATMELLVARIDKKVGAEFLKFSMSLLFISASLILMAKAIKSIGKVYTAIDYESFSAAVAAIVVMMIGIGIMFSLGGKTKDSNIGAIIAMIVGFGIVVAALAILYNINDTARLINTAAAMGLLFSALGVAFLGLSKVKISAGTMAGIAAMLLIMSGVMILVTYMIEKSVDKWPIVIGGLVGGILAVGGLLAVFGIFMRSLSKSADAGKVAPALFGIMAVILAVGGIMAALAGIALAYDNPEVYLSTIIGISMAMDGLILSVGLTMMLISKNIGDTKQLLPAMIALTAAVVAIGGVLSALVALKANPKTVAYYAATIGIALTALALSMSLVMTFGGDTTKANVAIITLASCVLAIGVVFAALTALKADPLTLGYYAMTIAGTLIIIAASMIAVMKLSKSTRSANVAIITMASSVLAIGIVFAALLALKADPNTLASYAESLSKTLVILAISIASVMQFAKSTKSANVAIITMASSVLAIGVVFAALLALKADPKTLVSYAASIGIALITLAISIQMVMEFAKSTRSANVAIITMASCVVAIGAVFAALTALNANPLAIISYALSIGIALELLCVSIIGVQKTSKSTKSANVAIITLASCVVAIGTIFAVLTALNANPLSVIAYALAIGITLELLCVSIMGVQKTASSTKSANVAIITMASSVLAIGAIFSVLAALDANPLKVGAYAFAMSFALVALSGAFAIVAHTAKSTKTVNTSLVIMLGSIVAIGTIFSVLAGLDANPLSVVGYAFAISVALMAISGAFAVIASSAKSTKTVNATLGIMVGTIAVIGIIFSVLSGLEASPVNVVVYALSISMAFGALAGVMALISTFKSQIMQADTLMPILAGAMIVAGACLSVISLTGATAKDCIGYALAMGAAIASVAVAFAIISGAGSTAVSAQSALGSVLVSLIAVSACMAVLLKIGGDSELTGGDAIGYAIAMGSALLAVGIALLAISKIGGTISTAAASIAIILVTLGVITACLAAIMSVGGQYGNSATEMISYAGAIAAVILSMAVALSIASSFGKSLVSAAVSLAIMSFAISAAGDAISSLMSAGSGQASSAIDAAISIAILVMAMGLALTIASILGVQAVAGGIALAVMSSAITSAASAISQLAGNSFESLIPAVAALCVVVLLMSVACIIASFGVAGAVALTVLVAAVSVLAGSLAGLASIDSKSLIIAAVTLAVFIAILVACGIAANIAIPGLIAISATMGALALSLLTIGGAALAFGVACNMIANSLIKVSKLDGEKIAENMKTIGAAIPATMGAFGNSLVDNKEDIKNGILTVMDIIVETIVESLQKIGQAVIDIATQTLTTLQTLLPLINSIISTILTNIITLIETTTPKMIHALKVVWDAIMGVLPDIIRDIMDLFIGGIDSLLNVIEEHMPSIVESGCNIVISFINGITEKLPDIIQAATDFIITFITGITESALEITNAAMDCVITFIDGIATAIDTHQDDFNGAMSHLFEAGFGAIFSFIGTLWEDFIELGSDIIEKIKEGVDKLWPTIEGIPGAIWEAIKEGWNTVVGWFKDLGEDIVDGITGGVDENLEKAENSGKKLGERTLNGSRIALDSHSPSRKFAELGLFCVQGLCNGIKDNLDSATKSGESIGNALLNPMSEAIAQASALTEDMNVDPTIRPVIDLSEVERGAGQISSLMKDTDLSFRNVNFGGYTNLQAAALNNSTKLHPELQNGTNNTENNSSIVFNQYNTSPKALSRIDIYRQTNNQISQLRGGYA